MSHIKAITSTEERARTVVETARHTQNEELEHARHEQAHELDTYRTELARERENELNALEKEVEQIIRDTNKRADVERAHLQEKADTHHNEAVRSVVETITRQQNT